LDIGCVDGEIEIYFVGEVYEGGGEGSGEEGVADMFFEGDFPGD
jgi:hypothetical protein